MKYINGLNRVIAFFNDLLPKKPPILKCPQDESNNNIEIKIITEKQLLILCLISGIKVDRF